MPLVGSRRPPGGARNGRSSQPKNVKMFLLFAELLNFVCTYNSKSVSRDESRKPFANGFESILSFVICAKEEWQMRKC